MYFWSRPSATSQVPYNASISSGSNIATSNLAMIEIIKGRINAIKELDPTNNNPIPVDLVTASGSGLDPHISISSAYYQIPRIAQTRNLKEQELINLVSGYIEPRQLGIFGEPRVNVFALNIALDNLSSQNIIDPQEQYYDLFEDYSHSLILGLRLVDWLSLILFFLILLLLIIPVGNFMAKTLSGQRTFLSPFLDKIECFMLYCAGVSPDEEMDWKNFVAALMIFSIMGIFTLFFYQVLQHLLPLNPAGLGTVKWDLSLNTAVSFVTNTNWQAYGGENTLSYLTQMIGCTVQNFVSAASGMAILVALIYGFSRKSGSTIGNFWVLLIRSVMILLPISGIVAILLVSQGCVQTFSGPITVPLLDSYEENMNGIQITTQTISRGPAASQIAIKMLGVNGGGFFNSNSSHPFENPTPIANFIEMIAMGLIPFSLCYTFGKMIGSVQKGIAILVAMIILFLPFAGLAIWSEVSTNSILNEMGINQIPSSINPGGNMEGKEIRFGPVQSAFFSILTTAESCGAVNSMHDSFNPLGGFAQLFMMQLGEIVFGGIGSGLYGMIVFVIIAMFIAGLMVGRTPEYLGKKIEPYEMKMATIIILIPIFLILSFTTIAVLMESGRIAVLNPGPHGFSEILYAFTSASQNNGSAFAGLSVNSVFYNISTAIAMFIGRFITAIFALALAGSFVKKKIVPISEGTLRDHSPLFIIWLIFVILIIGALSYLPVLALGPIVDYLLMLRGVFIA